MLSTYAGVPPNETYMRAREAALKALEIDETLVEAHTALGQIKTLYEWDWDGSEREYERAIELNPGAAQPRLRYALNLMFRGRYDEAIAHMNTACEWDPLSPDVSRMGGLIFHYAGKYDEAIEVLESALEMDPNAAFAHLWLAMNYAQKSMYKEALAELEKKD